MGRPTTIKPETPFGIWLYEARERFGVQKKQLALRANIGQSSISQLEAGIREPSRDMVQKLAFALAKDADADAGKELLNEGLKAAGFMPSVEYVPAEEPRVIAYLRGKPEHIQDKALKMMQAAFDEDDEEEDTGSIGRRAKD